MTAAIRYAFTLRELDATFVRRRVDPEGWEEVDSLSLADGVQFLCPRCFRQNDGRVGTHMLLCWFEDKVPDDVQPGPGRWSPVSTDSKREIDSLTFVVGKKSNSIAVGKHLHGFVRNGRFEVDGEGAE